MSWSRKNGKWRWALLLTAVLIAASVAGARGLAALVTVANDGYQPIDFTSWLVAIVAVMGLAAWPIMAPKKKGGHGALPRLVRTWRYRLAVARMERWHDAVDNFGRPVV